MAVLHSGVGVYVSRKSDGDGGGDEQGDEGTAARILGFCGDPVVGGGIHSCQSQLAFVEEVSGIRDLMIAIQLCPNRGRRGPTFALAAAELCSGLVRSS